MRRGRAQCWAMAASVALVVAACGRGDDGADVAGVEVTASTTAAPIAETTTTVPPPTTQLNYVVQSGDSLSVIASRFGISTDELANFNAISDVNSIVVGQELSIPPTTVAAPESTTTVAG